VNKLAGESATTLQHSIVPTNINKFQIMGKAIPLQVWTGPEGSRFGLPDFKTIGT
jgi:hypothetical protein